MKTHVNVCFYSRDIYEKERFVQWATKSDVVHCGIMLTVDNLSVVLASDKSHNAKFINSESFHSKVMSPKYTIYLGERDVSIQQLETFMGNNYIGDTRSIIFWWFIGRHLFPSYQPKSCALLTSQMLRVCGLNIQDHVSPHTLLKELQDATNNYRGPSRSR